MDIDDILRIEELNKKYFNCYIEALENNNEAMMQYYQQRMCDINQKLSHYWDIL